MAKTELREITEIENVWITMSDGCRIAARTWLPAGAEAAPVPAILEYIPYRKRDFMRARDEIAEMAHPHHVLRGSAPRPRIRFVARLQPRSRSLAALSPSSPLPPRRLEIAAAWARRQDDFPYPAEAVPMEERPVSSRLIALRRRRAFASYACPSGRASCSPSK
jgi:hypothetical protein